MQIHTCKKINDTNYRLIKSTKSIAIKTLACRFNISIEWNAEINAEIRGKTREMQYVKIALEVIHYYC